MEPCEAPLFNAVHLTDITFYTESNDTLVTGYDDTEGYYYANYVFYKPDTPELYYYGSENANIHTLPRYLSIALPKFVICVLHVLH